jgi:hypothetical protein
LRSQIDFVRLNGEISGDGGTGIGIFGELVHGGGGKRGK